MTMAISELQKKKQTSKHLRSPPQHYLRSVDYIKDGKRPSGFEWTSFSIVGVFLLFFIIVAAFYLYNRMRFDISHHGVNLNELSLSIGFKVRAFLWRTVKYTTLVITIISFIFSIIQYISHKKKLQTEDHAAVQDLVKKSIELLQSPDEPRSMPVINMRDTLLTPQQRKDIRWKRIWSKVVEFIENNDYNIISAIEEIDGEEFKTWKWCGGSSKSRLSDFRMDATTMRTGTIEWQGSAFDSASDIPVGGGKTNQKTCLSNGSINSLTKALTKFLKLRNIPFKASSSNWKTHIRNAIIEKCKEYSPSNHHGILHIDFCSGDKNELFIYLKCDSIESATNNFAALHGWWCERSLVSVKFLKAERYYEKFPRARTASSPLQILKIDS